MSFRIREATPADLPQIEEVMRASMSALGARFYTPEQTASAVRYIAVADRQLIADRTYYAVTDGDRIIGCGGWSARKKLFTGTDEQAAVEGRLDPGVDAARVRAMFVHPAYARRGVGRLILDTSEAAARKAGFRCFELMATMPGVPLYRACGYEPVEDVDLELPDGTKLPGVRMTRADAEPPRSIWPLLLAGWAAVLLNDVGGAWISRETGIAYEWFGIGTLIIYVTFGILATRRRSVGAAAVVALAMSMVEMTLGWWLAWQIGPGKLDGEPNLPFSIMVTMVFSLSAETTVAVASGAIWSAIRRRRAQ